MAGKTIFILLLLLAALFAIPAVSAEGGPTWLSLTASSVGFVAMALNMFLATRPAFIESLFGGLDRMYRFHRTLGITALFFILVHYFITPDFKGTQLPGGIAGVAREVGEWGFYGLVALIVLSWMKRIPFTKIEIPYHLWRQSHRLMGLLFMAIAFHQFFVKRPESFTANSLLNNYLMIAAAIGTLSFLWTQFVAFARRRSYEITDVKRLPAATLIEAKPVRRPLRATPGQFGFLHFGKTGLREPHPFTIAGIRPDGAIRFAIKPLGDFTTRLRELAAPGDRILVEGGYGRFNHVRGGNRQVWLAGGIGITPFLAMAESLTPDEKRKIHLVHCVKDSTEAVDADILARKTKEVPNFSFHLHDSKVAGRIDADKLVAGTPFEMDGADLWFCGPPPLRDAIVAGLRQAGRKLARVEFELFEFR